MILSITVRAKDAGRKIKYFVRSDMQISYHQYCVMKADGGLRVNGETVHANYELREGDRITAELTEQGAAKKVAPENLPVRIAFEDDDIYIIEKPAPLPCQCTPMQPGGTLENRIMYRFANVPDFVFRPLNRLDKGTSGLMCAAKHAHAFQILQKQLHTDAFVREYEAIVEGVLEGEGTVDLPIGKAPDATVRRIIDPENGKRAVTHYRVIRTDGRRTLVRLRLETGRTHQIRVHMAAIGHPVTGDFLYGSEMSELPERFALHAAYITLIHPLTGETVRCESPMPEALKELMLP